jgi:hypothetical protein
VTLAPAPLAAMVGRLGLHRRVGGRWVDATEYPCKPGHSVLQFVAGVVIGVGVHAGSSNHGDSPITSAGRIPQPLWCDRGCFPTVDSLTGKRRRHMQALRDRVEQIWERVVDQGRESGDFADIDPLFVKVALGALNYSVLWYRADGALTPEETADRTIALMLSAPSPEPVGTR